MRREVEVGAVLLLLIGCGPGLAPSEPAPAAKSEKPPILANADDPTGCPAGTYGLKAAPPTAALLTATGSGGLAGGTGGLGGGGGGGGDMTCETCDPGGGGGGDPTEVVPYGSSYVRSIGARTYGFHRNTIRPTVNARLYNGSGVVIGHVSFGGQWIPNGYYGGHPQSYVSAHVHAPNNATEVWIHYGVLRAGNGQPYPWVAVKDGAGAAWSRYMTVPGFRAWFAQQPATKRAALIAAAQASEDTKKQQQNNPFSPRINDLFNADGSCTGTTWLTLILVGVTTCPDGIVPACAAFLVGSAYCTATWITPPNPPPTPPPPTPDTNPVPPCQPDPQPVPDPANPQEPVTTEPGDPGGTGGSEGGGTEGSGPYAPEGDGGGDGGGAGCP